MDWIKRCILLLTYGLSISAFAADAPVLNIGLNNYSPPFISRSGNNQFFGFDVSMMQSLCDSIQRTCAFVAMPFGDLIDSVVNNIVPVAVGNITVTADRATKVSFTLPYLPSVSQFLTRRDLNTGAYNLHQLDNKKIGVQSGSLFTSQIIELGIINPQIIDYPLIEDVIAALHNKDVDFVLIDAPSAMFWQSETDNLLEKYGPPLNYGYGLAIAVNKTQGKLLQQLNAALKSYQQSKDFTTNYGTYLGQF